MRRARPSAICCKKICKDYDVGGFSDASSLIFSGRFQSLAVLRIAAFLEQRWNLDFAQGFEQSQLDSVEEMMNFLRSATLPRGIAADAIAADALQRYLAVLVPPVLVTHAAKQRLTWVTKSPNIKVQMAYIRDPKAAYISGDYRGEDIDHSAAEESQENSDRKLLVVKDRRCHGADR